MDNKLPMLKKAKGLTERITIPCDPALKEDLARLKKEKGVDVTEWIRQMIKDNMKRLV